jgi:hypothetical protein
VINTVNWTIISADGGLQVRDCNQVVATIITEDGQRWRVHFVRTELALDFEWDNLNVCVGYVRGIERVQVNLAHGVKFKKVEGELV